LNQSPLAEINHGFYRRPTQPMVPKLSFRRALWADEQIND